VDTAREDIRYPSWAGPMTYETNHSRLVLVDRLTGVSHANVPSIPPFLLLRPSDAAAPTGEAIVDVRVWSPAAVMPSWNDGESSNESSVCEASTFSNLISRVRV
jgi:hypothetical protein